MATCRACGHSQPYAPYAGGAALPENVTQCSVCGGQLDTSRFESGPGAIEVGPPLGMNSRVAVQTAARLYREVVTRTAPALAVASADPAGLQIISAQLADFMQIGTDDRVDVEHLVAEATERAPAARSLLDLIRPTNPTEFWGMLAALIAALMLLQLYLAQPGAPPPTEKTIVEITNQIHQTIFNINLRTQPEGSQPPP
jgi:hypothetical protein